MAGEMRFHPPVSCRHRSSQGFITLKMRNDQSPLPLRLLPVLLTLETQIHLTHLASHNKNYHIW